MTISYSNLLRLFISSWVVFLLCISHAYAEPLSIKIDAPTSVAGDSFYGIFLDGEIDKDAPRRLTEILRKIPTNGAINIYLNSSGGNLFAGMELGRIFRKLGASTSISKMGSDKNNSSRNGVCYSACSLAYLGGLYRYANTEAIYGVHRISSSMGPTNQDLDVGQIVSAAVSTYLIEMGIDARLFKLIANTSASDIYILSSNEMRELYVANNGRSPPEWEVKVFPGGYYLRGQQNTYYGFGKVVLSCVNKRVILMSVYSAGDKSLTIAKGGWTHALRIDGEEISLSEPKLVDIYAKDDNIISSFALEKLQINKILKAKSIGHSMKPSSMAAFYVGYDVDIDDADRAKVRDYILNCK